MRQVSHPTRDVYVIRTTEGDRIFDSFGQNTNTYCDCFITSSFLPKAVIQDAEVLVMGTLGLAYSETSQAMQDAMALAKKASTLVMIDCNWRPVFWDEPDSALDVIRPFMEQADLVKITDEEAEWAYGISAQEALKNPARVRSPCSSAVHMYLLVNVAFPCMHWQIFRPGHGEELPATNDKVAVFELKNVTLVCCHLFLSLQVLDKLPNARAVLVTAGGAGAAFCIKAATGSKKSGFVPVYDVKVQDTTGAGDAFTCGFLAYLLLKVCPPTQLCALINRKSCSCICVAQI